MEQHQFTVHGSFGLKAHALDTVANFLKKFLYSVRFTKLPLIVLLKLAFFMINYCAHCPVVQGRATKFLAPNNKPPCVPLMSAQNLIGPRVRHFREERGWTQEELAAELGTRGWHCTGKEVDEIERREAPVSAAQFMVFGYVFGVDHNDLFPPELDKEFPGQNGP